VGLHPDPRRDEERRPPSGALYDPAHSEGGGPSAHPAATDLLADFFTTEVWTWRGLVTYYTVFAIDLASRRVHVLGSTPHPSDLFMDQLVRRVTAADDGALVGHHVLVIGIGSGAAWYANSLARPASAWS